MITSDENDLFNEFRLATVQKRGAKRRGSLLTTLVGIGYERGGLGLGVVDKLYRFI